ncbi:ATP-binding protein [Chitinophaga sp. MM2321]|uniref:ATP-binding response regulator n=1 Tax=Chitinophaga sp. MM2321 TaxID=3137178 RepID=UPI0032D59454
MKFVRSIFQSGFLSRLIKTGTSYATTEEERKGVIVVNCLCLTTAALVLLIGTIFIYLLESVYITIPVILEFLAFCSIVFINRAGKIRTAKISMYCLQCLCATYFGILMGPVVEIQLLIIFLIMASFLITKNKLERRIYLFMSIVMVILTEVNFYYDFVHYIPTSRNVSFLFRWLAMTGILTLILEVINFYDQKNIEYQEKLEKSDQSKSIFVKQVSHEIRTPLNGIYGIAQLMKEDASKYPELVQLNGYVSDLIDACHDAKAIINNVLDLAEIEKGKLHNLRASSFELRSWLNGVVSMHKYVAFSKEVSIQVEIDPELPDAIIGDEIKLKQILHNLLSNAIKFTNNNTVIEVKATRFHQRWLLSVKDAGDGIREENLKTIFEPFVKTENRNIESTGLGLYITRQLAGLLGGEIRVRSSLGNGTLFQVSLPLMAGVLPAIPTEEMKPDLQGYKALVIEDNPMSQKILTNLLKGMGATTAVADNGIEGLSVAASFIPDIIFVDAHMPLMDGDETIYTLRKDPQFVKTLIIAVTADGFNDDAQTMIRAGADELIPKPIAFVEVRALLKKHLSTHPVVEH